MKTASNELSPGVGIDVIAIVAVVFDHGAQRDL